MSYKQPPHDRKWKTLNEEGSSKFVSQTPQGADQMCVKEDISSNYILYVSIASQRMSQGPVPQSNPRHFRQLFDAVARAGAQDLIKPQETKVTQRHFDFLQSTSEWSLFELGSGNKPLHAIVVRFRFFYTQAKMNNMLVINLLHF